MPCKAYIPDERLAASIYSNKDFVLMYENGSKVFWKAPESAEEKERIEEAFVTVVFEALT